MASGVPGTMSKAKGTPGTSGSASSAPRSPPRTGRRITASGDPPPRVPPSTRVSLRFVTVFVTVSTDRTNARGRGRTTRARSCVSPPCGETSSAGTGRTSSTSRCPIPPVRRTEAKLRSRASTSTASSPTRPPTGGPLARLTPGLTVTVRVTVRRDLVWIRTVHPAAFRVLSPPRSSPRARSPGTARFKSQTRFRRRSAIGGVSRRSRVRFLAGTPFPELFRMSDKTLGRDADRTRAARDSSIPCSRRITTTARMARDPTRWVEKKGRLVGWSPGKSCDARAFSRRRRSRARRRGARTRRVAVEKKVPGSIPGWAERASFLPAGSRFEASS
mmetsp:Transcript_6330/g.24423  ORF Transcript_6330/g.24423 Transcript_6330/m.24423 type:complete len:331 (+) Transcript_6330:962-1954(+)